MAKELKKAAVSKSKDVVAKKTAKKAGKKAAVKPAPKAVKKVAKKPASKKLKAPITPHVVEQAEVLSSEVVFQSATFRIVHDKLIEPGGKENERDIIRHNGSAVILALDYTGSKKDPWVVMERQYRHAANQYLWELPAGKIEEGEDPVEGAQRELEEETGYHAKKWKPLVEFFASPGFLAEAMKVYLAEGLTVGAAHPEGDESIEVRMVKLSDVLKMIEKGMIVDGKTLISVLLFARQHKIKHGK